MKKVKILGGVALATIAGLGLTACDDSSSNTLDISVVYKEDQGPTYKQATSFEVDGKTYTNGSLLPMWEVLQEKFGVTIKDVGNYQSGSTQSSAQAFMDNQFKGVGGENVELLMATLSQVTTMYTTGNLTPISDYFDQMPNFSKYLEDHPSVWNQLKQADGKVYSAVYFDGVDDIEKYFMISSSYVKKLLDGDTLPSNLDTATKITEAYQPFNEEDKDYDVLVTDADGTGSTTVHVSYDHSAIYKQNQLSTLDGKNLVESLRKHIDDTYMNLEDANGDKLYTNRSDVFLTNRAAYNTDDFIALWRCIKTNPQYLNGSNSIDVFVPRNNDSNRQRQVLSLMQMFGQKGADAEKERLYFDQNGELQDARTQDNSYAVINIINTLYKEGLIIQEYDGTAGQSTSWRDQKLEDGTGAVFYDYAQSTAAVVPDDMLDHMGLVAIMPPAVDWGIYEKDGEKLGNGDGTYIHFSEDARSLKTGAWCIPSNADSDMIETAVSIIDYFYSDEGADLCDFGPNTTTYRKAVTTYDENGNRVDPNPDSLDDGVGVYKGDTYVVVADRIYDQITNMNENLGLSGGWFEYYTRFVGNSLGFGNIRSSALEYQFVEQEYMQPAMSEVSEAIAAGSMLICDTAAHKGSSLFFSCVPTSFPLTDNENQLIESVANGTINEAWRENSKNKTCGYTALIKNGVNASQLSSFKAVYEQTNNAFLNTYRTVYARMSGSSN